MTSQKHAQSPTEGQEHAASTHISTYGSASTYKHTGKWPRAWTSQCMVCRGTLRLNSVCNNTHLAVAFFKGMTSDHSTWLLHCYQLHNVIAARQRYLYTQEHTTKTHTHTFSATVSTSYPILESINIYPYYSHSAVFCSVRHSGISGNSNKQKNMQLLSKQHKKLNIIRRQNIKHECLNSHHCTYEMILHSLVHINIYHKWIFCCSSGISSSHSLDKTACLT